MYSTGFGPEQDFDQAIALYKKSSALGNSRSMFHLGWINFHGMTYGFDENNYLQACVWFDAATSISGFNPISETAEEWRKISCEFFRWKGEKLRLSKKYREICRTSRYTKCDISLMVSDKTSPTKPPGVLDKKSDDQLVLIGAGSSFIISKNGHLLTNQHVVDGCRIVTIHLPSGLRKVLVVATDDTNDLALLKTDLEDDNFIPISGTNVSLLEDVVVAGYPLSGSLSTTVKVTKGVVSSLAGLRNDYSQIQIDAAVQPGNSGGPILNDQGNVVAVTVAALNKELFLKEQGTIPENTNFGIKSSTARAFVDANGVKLPQPYTIPMSRRDMADLITKTTHLVGCWVSRATAQKMASGQKQELSVTPTMQRQVEALR